MCHFPYPWIAYTICKIKKTRKPFTCLIYFLTFVSGFRCTWKPHHLSITENPCDIHTLRTFNSYGEMPLQWRRNGCEGISNHQPYDCSLSRLFKAQIKETSKLRVTGLCEGNSPGTGEFPAQKASNAEYFSIWWRHHGIFSTFYVTDVTLWMIHV